MFRSLQNHFKLLLDIYYTIMSTYSLFDWIDLQCFKGLEQVQYMIRQEAGAQL